MLEIDNTILGLKIFLPAQCSRLACRPQRERQAMHILFAAENCTAWPVAAAADGVGAQYPDCCSMVVDAAAVAAEIREDSSAGLHPVTRAEVVTAQDDCSFHTDYPCMFRYECISLCDMCL